MKAIQTYEYVPLEEAKLRDKNFYFCFYEGIGKVLMLQYLPAKSDMIANWGRDGDYFKAPDWVAEIRVPPLPDDYRERALAQPLEIEMEDGEVQSFTCPNCYHEQGIPEHLWNGHEAKRVECQKCKDRLDIAIHASYQRRGAGI